MTYAGMSLHNLPFVLIEFARLFQNSIGDADFAGIVHGCGQFQQVAALLVPAYGLGQGMAVSSHAPDMNAGVGIVVMAGFTKHMDRIVITFFKPVSPDQR